MYINPRKISREYLYICLPESQQVDLLHDESLPAAGPPGHQVDNSKGALGVMMELTAPSIPQRHKPRQFGYPTPLTHVERDSVTYSM
jgi:hypothetical protein